MISRADLRRCLIYGAMLLASPLLQAQAAGVSGRVVDAQGVPVAGARVLLHCDAAAAAESVTGADGRYEFNNLASCEYRLSAEKARLVAQVITIIVNGSVRLVRDLSLIAMPVGTGTAEGKPKFEASGVRGLIDPGGYSAPAYAAAASGLISGLSNVKGNVVGRICVSGATVAESKSPHGVPAGADLAERLLNQQHFEAASEALRTVPPEGQDIHFHHLLARSDEGLREFRDAAGEYRVLEGLEPSDTNIFGAGYDLLLAGAAAEAAEVFREGLLRLPESIPLLIGRGTAEFLLGRTSVAITAFLRAADLDPADARPYPFLAAAWAATPADADRVRAALERHVALKPDDASGLLAYATILLQGANGAPPATGAKTKQLLEHAIALAPDLAQAHFELGVLYARDGDDAEAVPEMERALRLEPGRAEWHYRLALALRRTGRADAASREMQVFEQARAEERLRGPDVQQMLSVVAAPSGPAACPDRAP